LIFSSINAEADSTGLFVYTSNSRTYFSGVYPEPLRFAQSDSPRKGERDQRNLQPPQLQACSAPILRFRESDGPIRIGPEVGHRGGFSESPRKNRGSGRAGQSALHACMSAPICYSWTVPRRV
jgi:hypothetical protein